MHLSELYHLCLSCVRAAAAAAAAATTAAAASRALQWRAVLVDNVAHGHASLQEAARAARPFLVPLHLPHWAAATTYVQAGGASGGTAATAQAAQAARQQTHSARAVHGKGGTAAAIGDALRFAYLGPHQRLELTEID